MATDKYHGQGGTFIVKNGERVPLTPDRDGKVTVTDGEGKTQTLHRPDTKPHEDGKGGARDAKGQRLDKVDPNAKPEPAMPEPGPAPWAASAEEKKSEAAAKTAHKEKN